MDALHLACAKIAGVDHFITTDFGILKKRLADIQALNPLDFVQQIKGSEQS
jgi:predicted nucleic acid-binding protein